MLRSQNCHARGKWAPSWPPRRGWQDKTALCLKETRDNEIIFNLCPFEALPAPVILDGTAREGALHIHTKPGNYCTNYSLLMLGEGVVGCDYRPLVQVNNSSARAPAEAGAARWWTVVPLLFPSQIFDLLSCLQSVLLGKGVGEGKKTAPKLLIAQQQQEWGAQAWPSVPSPTSHPFPNRNFLFKVSQFLRCPARRIYWELSPRRPCVTMRNYFS